MSVRYTKKQSSSQSYGRGKDQAYTPPQYWIVRDEKRIGFILGKPRGYMGKAEWDASWLDSAGKERPYGGAPHSTLASLKRAVEGRVTVAEEIGVEDYELASRVFANDMIRKIIRESDIDDIEHISRRKNLLETNRRLLTDILSHWKSKAPSDKKPDKPSQKKLFSLAQTRL